MTPVLGPVDSPLEPPVPVRVSVIIPTFQRRDLVARALRALGAQTLNASAFEVTVVDDGSDDGTREFLAAVETPFHLHGLRQPHLGAAAARNGGIRRSLGELLVFLDDDMEPASTFLEAHWAAHRGVARQAVLGAVPFRPPPYASPVEAYVAGRFHDHLARLATPDRPIGIRDFYGGNFSIRRALLDEVGLFDETFQTYGNEDLELALRLRRAGVPLAYSPDALAYQRYAKNLMALASDARAKGRTAVALAGKYPEFAAQSKLATWRSASPARRRLIRLLLGLSRLWGRTPDMAVQVVHWIEERRQLASLPLFYSLLTDYLFWLGVRSALAEGRAQGPEDRLLGDVELP